MAQDSKGPISTVVNVRSMIPLVFLGLVIAPVSSSVFLGLVMSPILLSVFLGLIIAPGSLLRITLWSSIIYLRGSTSLRVDIKGFYTRL